MAGFRGKRLSRIASRRSSLVTRHASLLLLITYHSSLITVLAQDQYAELRERMVSEQIIARGVANARVLAVMREVPRHLFVPPRLAAKAYSDGPLPIGSDQTISQPYIVALMTELLQPEQDNVVLEIGTGTGYQAAVLSRLVKQVRSIEIVPALAQSAGERLKRLGYSNVTVKSGDGYLGWPELAPFDAIIVTAAPPEIPSTLVAQLKRGGRMVVPVGDSGSQRLVVLEKSRTSDDVVERTVIPVRFVPMVRSPATTSN